PRPDERHIRYQDVYALSQVLTTELNIEGNPQEQKFVDLVLDICPAQVTLVPDAIGQLTSNHGWDTIKEQSYLRDIIAVFKAKNIRVSIFVDPEERMVAAAKDCGTDRVELYTEVYAKEYVSAPESAVWSYAKAAQIAQKEELGLNAG